MRSKYSYGKIVLIILLGAMAGSLLGELIIFVMPEGVVKQFFVKPLWQPAFGPLTLDLIVFSITLGFALKVNLIGFIGVLVAIYLLRWY